MSSPSQTAASSTNFKSVFDTALAQALVEYKKKTGKDLRAHQLAHELETCESVNAVLNILRNQAKAFEQPGDQKLMKWIDPLVHVLYTFSGALGDGVSLAFPPAKVIFTGIGILLAAAKDVRASHGAIIDLFECIENFFKRLEVYTQISLTTEMAGVLVKIVIELLSILSIATKEVKRRRAKIFARKILGRTDIEDALKRLNSLIQEEVQMVTTQILKVATEVKDGADNTNMAIQQMLNDIEEVKRDVVEVKWTQIEQDIYKWLSPPDSYTNYNIVCKAHYEGTAAWFFEASIFKDWMSTGSLLWMHGKPGSGKSVLCSAIIKHVMSLRDAGHASLAFFYFDFRDKDKKQDLRNFVTSLLVQLSAYSSLCCKIISRIYSTHGKGTQQPGDDTLINGLRQMLLVATQQPTYIIVDALDECPNASGMPTPREAVLDLLEGLVRLGLPNLHICVTSRPEVDINNVLGSLASTISLHDEIGQKKDISDYVGSVVSSDRMIRRWRNDEKELVIEELSEKADGMFRWVFCQLEVLRHCLPASIRETLKQLPKSLDETYLRVLSQIPQSNQAHAHRMLQCLVVAIRPLSVEELAELLAFEFDAAQGGIPKYRAAWRLDDQTEAVLSTCSSLVTIVDDLRSGRQVVQFSHFSVKEFLMSDRLTSPLGDFSRYQILPGPAHTILTQACLGFLLHLDNYIDEESVARFPLAKYAAQHWVEHAQFEDVASRVKDGMETLFDSDKPHFAAWVGVYDIDDPSSGRPRRGIPNPLYYSALCGFYDLIEYLAVKNPQHVNAICGRYGSPLLAALSGDHVKIAELLLEHGASVDVRRSTGKTILLTVISQSQDDLVNKVKLLLKHGANVNARDNTLRSSVHLAEDIGKFEVAEILLAHNADANSQDNNGRTPLHILLNRWMYEDEALEHARLLLMHGAEVNIQDKDKKTPLLLGIGRDWFKLAWVLLERGADPNVENNGKTPLHILSERHIYDKSDVNDDLNHARPWQKRGTGVNKDSETSLLGASVKNKTGETSVHQVSGGQCGSMEPLLERSVNINAQDANHTTPLQLQSNHFGPVQMAQALLDHGANVNAGNNGGETSSSRELTGMDVQNMNRPTPLHLASLYGRPDIARVLLERGTAANSEDNFGRTPLHLLAVGKYNFEQDRIRIAQLLLECGANVNAQDKDNATPLHLASHDGRVAIARVLLDHGAGADSKGNQGRTPLHLVAEGRHLYSEDDGIRVAQLLLERGADVNVPDEDNRTPLHLASYNGRVEIARVLLDGGATTNPKDNQGRTPLHAVAEGGDYTSRENDILVAQLLLERGADVDMRDHDNQTPLHSASNFGKVEMVLILLNTSADANAKDARGRTPLHLASQCPSSRCDIVSVVRLLLEHGADVNAQDQTHATPLDLASYYGRTEVASLFLRHHDRDGVNAKIDQDPTPSQLGLEGVQFHDCHCPPKYI